MRDYLKTYKHIYQKNRKEEEQQHRINKSTKKQLHLLTAVFNSFKEILT